MIGTPEIGAQRGSEKKANSGVLLNVLGLGVTPNPLTPLPDISESVPFKPLVSALSFIKNKVMWSGSIRGAMRTIPEEDYQQNVAGGKGN